MALVRLCVIDSKKAGKVCKFKWAHLRQIICCVSKSGRLSVVSVRAEIHKRYLTERESVAQWHIAEAWLQGHGKKMVPPKGTPEVLYLIL